MKLRRLYSDRPEIFPEIAFKEGLNVIFARVQNYEFSETDSHNLGKTILISVLDFALLAKIDKKHPFRRHKDIFGKFTFFLEIETGDGRILTIKRADRREGIFIHTHSAEEAVATLGEDDWSYPKLGIDSAREILDGLLNLVPLRERGYGYRKGLRYCLRRQSDYLDPFRLSTFASGKDRDWKPYVALLLGYDPELLLKKYETQALLKEQEIIQNNQEKRANSSSRDYDELRATIELRENQQEKLRAEVEAFSFKGVETDLREDLVSNIETRASVVNQRLYEINFQQSEIEVALDTNVGFDLSAIRQVFEETKTFFPPEMLKSYEDLVQFSKEVTSGRTEMLKDLRSSLASEAQSLLNEQTLLDSKRQEALSALTERETLKKYSRLQAELFRNEERIFGLKSRLSELDEVGRIERRIKQLESELEEQAEVLESTVREFNPAFAELRKRFSEIASSILNLEAILVTRVNQSGNIDFELKTLSAFDATETSEGLGTSYKKVLCAAFDLSVLEHYCKSSFYKFVYHDGIFEGLDNRRKRNLLDTVRQFSLVTGVQYILTVIDSDLPRDDQDRKLFFEEEVVRELHDGGDDGRLFKMPAF